MTAFLLDMAKEDLVELLDYFEGQSPGSGAEFLNRFEEAVTRIEDFPRLWSKVKRNYYICRLKRFGKYGVFYRIGRRCIYIHRIFNLQRGPGFWKKLVP